MATDDDLGPIATGGRSFRARAEARQREYRARVLRVGWSRYGYWLDDRAKADGRNFVLPEAHQAALTRAAAGKGVDRARTLGNMLASQEMCFNIFTPLARDPTLAWQVLRPSFPEMVAVRNISIEYTPPFEIFRDQSGRGGVDCDVLIEATWADGSLAVIGIETKFVEVEFSNCGFRDPGREAKGKPICPDEVPVASDRRRCLYSSLKGYQYWEQTERLSTLHRDALPSMGCPFGGPEWQLWVNHTLVHAEADRRGARHALFAVCAPAANEALLGGDILGRFGARLVHPHTFRFVPLDGLVDRVEAVVTGGPAELLSWSRGLTWRYADI